jgi:hypothetical protein
MRILFLTTSLIINAILFYSYFYTKEVKLENEIKVIELEKPCANKLKRKEIYIIHLKTGEIIESNIIQASDLDLEIRTKKSDRVIDRDDIWKIQKK